MKTSGWCGGKKPCIDSCVNWKQLCKNPIMFHIRPGKTEYLIGILSNSAKFLFNLSQLKIRTIEQSTIMTTRACGTQ